MRTTSDGVARLLGSEARVSARWLADANRGCSHFPRKVRSSYEYVLYHRSEDSLTH